MTLFALQVGHWYACELIGDEFTWGIDLRSHSPIRVDRLTPLKKGDGSFELEFFHWNYPQGVQQKTYRLRTLQRGQHYTLAQRLDHEPVRLLLIYDITEDWVRRHFPNARAEDRRLWFGHRRQKSVQESVRIYGLDFTSAPCKKKPLTCAICAFDGDVLRLEELKPLVDFNALEELLASPGPWILGADFPFGQPRKLVENVGWPITWEGYVKHIEAMGKHVFEQTLREYSRGRGTGDMHHKRAVDRPAGAQSPMKLDFIPVAKMFFEGAPRLARANVSVLPCKPTTDGRIVVEAYPALGARSAIGRVSYKESKSPAQAQERKAARERIFKWLNEGGPVGAYGFRVSCDDFFDDMVNDDGGDVLDSMLCAVQAAWAYSRREEGYGIPHGCDPLEGWIVDPILNK